MKIKINGKEYELPEAATLADALEKAGIAQRGIATAVNNGVVPATERTKKVLADGDSVIVITAFYGG